MIIPFRCYKCEKLLGDVEADCPCGGSAGATFGLRLGTPAELAGVVPQVPHEDGTPRAVAPTQEQRRIPAGTRLQGELLLRTPRWKREGVVELELVCTARSAQKKSNVGVHQVRVELARGPIEEHARWTFALDVPAFPPSHEGYVDFDWYLRATLTPTKGPATWWPWQLHVLPAGGTPPIERTWNRLASLAALRRDVRSAAFPVAMVGAWFAFPILAVVRAEWRILAVCVFLNAFLAWYAGGWALDELRRVARYARGWLLPRPGVRRVLRLGERAPITLDPRYDWALVRVEEASSRSHRRVGSRLSWITEWDAKVSRVCEGSGSGTVVLPPDQPPSITTWSRRIRWELRVWARGTPDVFHAYYLEVLSELAGEAAKSRAA